MKFGKYLEERKSRLPEGWADKCIDYTKLKLFLKTTVYLHSVKLDPTQMTWDSKDQPSFAQLLSERLAKLQISEAEFINMLDAEVLKSSNFFIEECVRLVAEHDKIVAVRVADGTSTNSASTAEKTAQLLQDVVTLERFVFLNYTGIIKILKKSDRHSGLSISDPYLFRVSSLPLVRAEKLSVLKQSLMNEFNYQNLHPNNVFRPSATPTPLSARRSPFSPTLLPASTFPPTTLLPNQKVLVSLSGPHGTDIIGAVLSCVAQHNCDIEDFMFSRLYHNVTFGVLITFKFQNVAIFQDLAAQARKWDATLTFDVPDMQATEPGTKAQLTSNGQIYLPSSLDEAPYENRVKYTATVLNQNGLTPGFLFEWTQLLLANRISVEKMARLNEGMISCADYKLSMPRDVDMEKLREKLFDLSRSHGTDVALQLNDVFRKNKRLVVFDMDSTLIQQEVIDEIAKYAGVVGEVAKITEAAMNGEIDFKESLRRRVGLLRGTSVDVLQTVKANLTFMEGARFLCRALKKIGFKLAVISGGFMPLALHVKYELGLDYAFANQLKVSSDGLTLTGETVGPIVDGQRKAELLEVIAQAEGVTLDQVIAVGDGANDLWMLAKAGLGIAFNAKPRVQQQARARINQKSLKHVLYMLGYTDEDMKQLHDE
ncbi:HAD-like domain-containing protein [Jimgerdemannia flammicorona]|uniref:phosphoserine phosphatase n=1 Tax=Jimgerdemannia flammicorona TaxID=994334 RepID=A0A433QRN5_9FUNG|nr:HAD-like domain-containing protein [Jimgerdemannia flammicorona]